MNIFEKDVELYRELKRLCRTRHIAKTAGSEWILTLFAVLGVDKIGSKIILGLLTTSIFGLLSSVALNASEMMKLIFFLAFLLSVLAFEILVVFNIFKEQISSGNYELFWHSEYISKRGRKDDCHKLSPIEKGLKRRERTVQGIIGYSTARLTRMKKHLEDEVRSRHSYLQLLLGGSVKLGAFPALFAVYAVYTGVLNTELSQYLQLAILTLVISMYLTAVIYFIEVRRLEVMIYSIDWAIARKTPIKFY